MSPSSSSSNKNHFLPPLPMSTNKASSSSKKVTIHRKDEQDTHGDHNDHDDRHNHVQLSSLTDNNNSSNDSNNNNSGCESQRYGSSSLDGNGNSHEQNKEEATLTSASASASAASIPISTTGWPKPFNDEVAIQRNKIKNLPNTINDIKSQIYDTKNINVRMITWNQQAKSLPSIEELQHHLFSSSSSPIQNNDDVGIGISGISSSGSGNVNSNSDSNGDAHDNSNKCNNHNNKYHMIVIGTQECENSISKSIWNPIKEHWEKRCTEALGDDYQFIQGHSLQASHLVVYAHRAILNFISNVQSHAVATGIYNTLGNKGGIGITLSIGKTSFCFVNAHLAAHQDQIDRRTVEFATISNQVAARLGSGSCSTNSKDNKNGDSNNFGDGIMGRIMTNERLSCATATTTTTTVTTSSVDESVDEEYRPLRDTTHDDSDNDDDENERFHRSKISQSCCSGCCSKGTCCCRDRYNKDRINPLLNEFDNVFWGGDLNYRINGTRDVIDSLLEEDRYDVLIANDQLNLLLQFEKTFSGFVEGVLTFRPTYKYDAGKDVYDSSSKKRNPSWTDRILYKMNSKVELLSYFCAQELRMSDHRPVYASFKCEVDIDQNETSLMEKKMLRSESRSEVCVIS